MSKKKQPLLWCVERDGLINCFAARYWRRDAIDAAGQTMIGAHEYEGRKGTPRLWRLLKQRGCRLCRVRLVEVSRPAPTESEER